MEKKKKVLKTERLVLKSYSDSDKDKMVEILCNEEIKETFMIPDFETREEAESLFFKLKEFSVSDSHFEYGIYLKDRLIGFLNDCEINDTMIEVEFAIYPEHKGNGYASEVLKVAIDEPFRTAHNHVTAVFLRHSRPSGNGEVWNSHTGFGGL